jgi:sigma-B regulation protein RsbU (phosphoserine phosphatase)
MITLVTSVQRMEEDTQKYTRALTDLTLSRIENALNRVEQMPVVLGRALEEPFPDYLEILKILQNIVESDLYIFGTCLAFEPYSFQKDSLYYAIYSWESPRGLKSKYLSGRNYNYFKKEWYKNAKELNAPVWSEPYFDLGGGDTLMCTYSVPFYKHGTTKVFKGVLTLDVSLSSLDKIVSQIKVYETGFGFLISKKGVIISYPDSTFINKNILDVAREKDNERLERIAVNMMEGKEGMESFPGFGERRSSEVFYAPLAKTGWSVGVVFPREEMYASLLDLVKYLLSVFGFILIAVLLVSIVVTRRLTRPISRLVKATHQLSQGNFDVEIPKTKRKDEVGVLTKSFNAMLDHLKAYLKTIQETTAEKEKIESELKIAHTIQMGMLPREFPDRTECELYAILDSARAVGGDLYDFFFIDQDHMFISVGDVSGKGVPASLFMTVVRTLYRSKTMEGQPLHQIMSKVNTELCKDNPNVMFVTMTAGIINLRTGFIELCNAGHNPPLLMDKTGKIRRISLHPAIPLGVWEYHGFKTEKVQLEPGDRFVLYTDGVTEALSAAGEFFTERRLNQILVEHAAETVPALVKSVVDSIHEFEKGVEQADDITLLILGYQKKTDPLQPPKETRHLQVINRLDELHRIVEHLENISADWNIPAKVKMEVNLVIEELFTNIVFYAFPDKTERRIDFSFSLVTDGTLQIRIEDDGRYFDLLEAVAEVDTKAPVERRQIGGLGIHFVKEMTDEINYIRTNKRNIVIITKHF